MVNISTRVIMPVDTPEYYNKFQKLQTILTKITNPYIFIIGCIGLITNTLTIALLLRSFMTKNLRHKWTLIALAHSDLVHNVALLIRVLHDITKGKIPHLCLTISFLSQLAELLSAWFTVLFTVQRYAAVRYPIQIAVEKRSTPIILLFFILTLSVVFCSILTYHGNHNNCHEEITTRWYIADALSSFIIPFSLILIFNLLIVNLIQQHGRSEISAHSTLSRNVKRNKNTKNRNHNKYHLQEESCLITSVSNYQPTGHTPISDTDMERKFDSTGSFGRFDENINSLNKKDLEGLYNNNNSETEISNKEIQITVSPVEIVNHNIVYYNNNNIQSSPQRAQSLSNGQRKSRNTSFKSNESQEEADCSSTKDGPTNQSIRVTRMLVLVSTCFLILNAPAHICVLILKIYTTIESHIYSQHNVLDHFQQTANLTSNQLKKFVFIETNNNNTMLYKNSSSVYDGDVVNDEAVLIHLLYISVFFTQLIAYASYAINFFLYSFSGVAFRTGLRQFIKKLRER
ncbi:hypothetical protein I4U23_026809 [Adineta vaga]|nr:hypothetical protein I4U23_026809 [Adineta vaga]